MFVLSRLTPSSCLTTVLEMTLTDILRSCWNTQHQTPITRDTESMSAIFINGFLGYFGDEQAFLVGSTAEQTKIRTPNDNSDADFLMVSGRLSIPASELGVQT